MLKKEDTYFLVVLFRWIHNISNTYLSCLCHLDTWLVREFLVLKSFPQWSQVWGFVGRWVSMWASKLSFLFPTLPQTLHLKNFWPSSKSSNIRFSGSGNPGMWLDLAKWKQRSEKFTNNLDIDFPFPCDRVAYGFSGIPCFLMAFHTLGSSVLHWGEFGCELWSSSCAAHSFHKRRMTTGSFLLRPGSSSYFAKLSHLHLKGEASGMISKKDSSRRCTGIFFWTLEHFVKGSDVSLQGLRVLGWLATVRTIMF